MIEESLLSEVVHELASDESFFFGRDGLGDQPKNFPEVNLLIVSSIITLRNSSLRSSFLIACLSGSLHSPQSPVLSVR